jgi:predicted RNase H-like HicB family nuclease
MKHLVKSKIPIFFIKEHDSFIAYSPIIDLSSFGKSMEEAKKNFQEALGIFIEECIKMGTLNDVLESCGWVKVRNNQWEPPLCVGEDRISLPKLAPA